MTSASLPSGEEDMPDRVRLPGHRMLLLAGRDAIAFAQAQFCNDVTALADGNWQWSAWLSAKGRVIALFMLQRENSETLRLLLPDADPQALAAGLQRYVFRSKVTISPEPGFLLGGVLGGAQGDAISDLDITLAGIPQRRLHRLGEPAQGSVRDGDAQWRLLDVRHGIPRLPATAVESYTAHMLGLDALGALALKKGCYPGQEIVARTHYLGRSKRSLQRLVLAGAGAAAGQPVLAGGEPIGEIVATAEHQGAHEALALLPTTRDELPSVHVLQVQAGDILLDARATAFLTGQRAA
jgi:folate-binding protein YgfZ